MPRHEKFVALRKFLEAKARELKKAGRKSFPMTFPEIEACLGFPLPPSAYKHREWWTNNDIYKPTNSFRDKPSKVWERAGFRTRDVDMAAHAVVFEYKGPLSPEDKARQEARGVEDQRKFRQALADLRERRPASGMSDASQPFSKNQIHPAFGSMKGLIRLVAGTDLTKPADPDWGKKDR